MRLHGKKMGMVRTWVYTQLDEYTQVVPIPYPTYTPCKRLGYTIGIPIDGYRLQSTQVLYIKEICDLPTGTYTSELARDLPRKCHAPDAAFECNVVYNILFFLLLFFTNFDIT